MIVLSNNSHQPLLSSHTLNKFCVFLCLLIVDIRVLPNSGQPMQQCCRTFGGCAAATL